MQLSISAVEVFISNTTKLFFSSQAFLSERHKMSGAPFKKLIISTLCLMPCALPAQAAEDVSAPANNASAVVAPATNAATPAVGTPPATNTVAPSTAVKPATNVATPAVGTPPATNTAAPSTAVTPASNSATPAATDTTPITDAVVTRPATEIGNLIASKQHPYLVWTDFTNRVSDLDALYQASGYQPIWLSNDSNATKNVAEVIKLLEDAESYGLKSADYETSVLQEKLSALKAPLDLKSKDVALYDAAISLSLLRYMNDLHYGRINPRNLHFNIQLREEKTLDLPELIKTHLAQGSLAQLPTLVEPKLPQYQKLKQALTDYRTTEKTQPLQLITKSTIRPGNPLPQSAELQQFLSSTGDLPANQIDKTASTYTDTLVEAVKKYQQRHGLKVNGMINKATVAAFAKPANSMHKLAQIELAMERLRWLPEINEGPAVMVNIPAFQLFAYDDINQESPTTTMRVVVGKAAKNQTPVLTADMLFIDFQPYWNVPYKIAKDEILPKLTEDPDYLARHNMEFVSGSGSSALRIRQRPGKGNALGKVKFIFPNKSDVYLHDTPSVSLFGRPRRDLSHGCVRVAHPQQLAEFVLKNEGNWDTGSIKKAMNGRNRRVTLKNSIPVFFLYNTAFFDESNRLTFYADIYQNDAKLLEALKKQRKDLADKDLFAPKEVPIEEEQPNQQIEANHSESATPANTKPVITASAKQAAPTANQTPTVATNTAEKPVSNVGATVSQ